MNNRWKLDKPVVFLTTCLLGYFPLYGNLVKSMLVMLTILLNILIFVKTITGNKKRVAYHLEVGNAFPTKIRRCRYPESVVTPGWRCSTE